MKKLSVLLCVLALIGLVILAACTQGNNPEDTSVPDAESSVEEATTAPDEESTSEPLEETSSVDESVDTSETETEGETWPVETSAPEVHTVTTGDIRVMILSDTLLRVELEKRGAFEDAPTFTIPGRDNFDGIPPEWVIQTETDGAITIETPRFTVCVAKGASAMSDVSVTSPDGESLLDHEQTYTDALYLPEPYDTPYAWIINDGRRLIKYDDPTDDTETPYTPNGLDYNGWTYTNNVRDYYIFVPAGDADQLRYDFNKLTGECEMVPLKTLGLWFSRFSKLSDQDFYDIIEEYYNRDFPLDVVVVDVDWKAGVSGTGYNINTSLFPNIEEFFRTANDMGVLTIFNDHVREYDGSMFDQEQLEWFNPNLHMMLEKGMNAWWYDRNWNHHLEAPFHGYDADLLGQDMYYTLTDQVNGNNRTWMLSNVYWINANNIVSTPHVSSHRYSLQWTGDIWCHASSLQLELENSVFAGAAAAMPYVLSDIGGHMGNPEEDLYIRWSQYGSLSSIMRYHANGYDRSPWKTSELAETISREYINMRYRLMPLYYSLARANYDTGSVIMRRLDFEYPQYEESRRNDQYLLGDNILIAPITSNAGSISTIIPKEWVVASDGTHGWDAEYYNNKNMSGSPAFTRIDEAINFDWGSSAPVGTAAIHHDGFSIRWTATLTNPTDTPICLASLSDDGICVSIDGGAIIDCWEDGAAPKLTNKEIQIQPGQTCEIMVEYYDNTGDAKAQLYYFPYLSPNPNLYLDYRDVFIPDGTWMDVWSGQTYTGPQTITVGHTEYTSPIFVKLGSFNVLAQNKQNLSTEDWSSLVIDMYPGAGTSEYELYEDDGTTEDYMEDICRRTAMSMTTEGKTSMLDIDAAKGTYTTDFTERTYVLRVHEYDGYTVKEIKVNGQSVDFTRIDRADAYTADGGIPFATEGASCDTDVVTITFTAGLDAASEITVSYN